MTPPDDRELGPNEGDCGANEREPGANGRGVRPDEHGAGPNERPLVPDEHDLVPAGSERLFEPEFGSEREHGLEVESEPESAPSDSLEARVLARFLEWSFARLRTGEPSDWRAFVGAHPHLEPFAEPLAREQAELERSGHWPVGERRRAERDEDRAPTASPEPRGLVDDREAAPVEGEAAAGSYAEHARDALDERRESERRHTDRRRRERRARHRREDDLDEYLERVDASAHALPPMAVDRFELLRPLGRGGQGSVYLARDPDLERLVAVKLLFLDEGDERARERLAREARALARAQSDGIATIHEVHADAAVPYLVMRYVPGESLFELLSRARRERQESARSESRVISPTPDEPPSDRLQPPQSSTTPARSRTRSSSDRDDEADERPPTRISEWIGSTAPDAIRRLVGIGERCARALHAAHEAGVLHRDVKPSNLLVTPDGEPVLVDFGLAKALGARDEPLTRSGELLGTPPYMAPEQLEGRALDARTDLWSLAVCLFEALTLEHPFARAAEAGSPASRARRMREEPAPLATRVRRDVPRALALVLDRALACAPERRYPTAAAFADDLRRFLDGEPIEASALGVGARLDRLWRRHRRGLAIASSILLVVGGLAWRDARRQARAREEDEARNARVLAAVQWLSSEIDFESSGFNASKGPSGRHRADRMLEQLEELVREHGAEGVGLEAPLELRLMRAALANAREEFETSLALLGPELQRLLDPRRRAMEGRALERANASDETVTSPAANAGERASTSEDANARHDTSTPGEPSANESTRSHGAVHRNGESDESGTAGGGAVVDANAASPLAEGPAPGPDVTPIDTASLVSSNAQTERVLCLVLAHALRETGDTPRSLELCERLLWLDPSDANIWINRGNLAVSLGRPEVAGPSYDRGLELDPDSAWGFAQRGDFRFRRGDAAGALADFARSAELNPSHPGYCFNHAALLLNTGRAREALEPVGRLIALLPDDPRPYQLRAKCFNNLREFDAALADVDRALEVLDEAPAGDAARREAERLQLHRERMQYAHGGDDAAVALESAEVLLAANPTEVRALENRGWALPRFGRNEEGLASLSAAIEHGAGASAFNQRGILLLHMERPAEALADLERAAELGWASRALDFNRAYALHLLGRNEEALARLEGLEGPEVDELRAACR